jgi:hypothetical protein
MIAVMRSGCRVAIRKPVGVVKDIIHEPIEKPTMKPESRDALLTAIAKARKWI